MQLEFAKSQDVKVEEEEEEEEGHRNGMYFDGTRRRPALKRNERQPSSRSFLEATGVIFPSTSLEVLAKGCLTTSTKKGVECNEGWGEFRQR